MYRTEIPASDLNSDAVFPGEGDYLVGLGMGYVVEVEEGNGYLSYPSSSSGADAAMPEDTLIVTFHDVGGNENYLLLTPECMVTVERANV